MNPGWRIVDLTGFCGSVKYERGQIRLVNAEIDETLPLAQLEVTLV